MIKYLTTPILLVAESTMRGVGAVAVEKLPTCWQPKTCQHVCTTLQNVTRATIVANADQFANKKAEY